MTDSQRERFQALRIRAERLVQSIYNQEFEASQQNVSKLLQELQTYQIELELQNEELINAQTKLEESRSEYRHLFEFAPVGYFVFDENGIIIDANSTGLDLLKIRLGQRNLVRKPFLVYLHGDDRKNFVQHIHRVIESGEHQRCELKLVRKDKSVFYAEMQSVPIYYKDSDEHIRVRTAITDITLRHQMQEELIEEREKALQAAKFMNEFLANMSHEIRTPLAGVIGFAEVLEEELPDEHQEVAKIISSGGNRLLNTLNSVLDFARLQAQSPSILLTPTNIANRVEEQCRLLKPLADQKDLHLGFNAKDREIYALVDTNFLDRIVSNLLSNAIKYTEEGSIKVSVLKSGDLVEIQVTDTGIGIDESFFPYLFEPFRQEHMGDNRPFEGVGLGLSITKRLVDLMEGEIRVESTPEEGTCFTVSFLKLDNDLRFFENDRPLFTNGSTEKHDLSNHNVLVVEDNWETAQLVKRILRRYCPLTVVSNIEEAVNVYTKESFNVALIDVNLGQEKTGTQLLHQLRKIPGKDPFYGVAFTAYALPSDQANFISQGFDDYLAKPFTKSALLELLKRAKTSNSQNVSV